VQDSHRGIYSHRLNLQNKWLVGGASNVGCAVLRQEDYTNSELQELSLQINPLIPSNLDYYPLISIGERFPINDNKKQPILVPKPMITENNSKIVFEKNNKIDRVKYLHGILEGISKVELKGYAALADLGATPLKKVILFSNISIYFFILLAKHFIIIFILFFVLFYLLLFYVISY
jgi:sugar (pentulose or hexulose) kinase